MTDTTVIIKTIGRPTLKAAIRSAKSEGFKTIVVSDGVKVSAQGATQFVRLGRKWGHYGGMAANVGAALATTEFITFLDDDDIFLPGAGDIIRKKLQESPEVDIWIGGVRFTSPVVVHDTRTGEEMYRSTDFAIRPERGIQEGNVAMPTYRTSIFEKVPFTATLPEEYEYITDINHVKKCEKSGYKIDWFKEVLYLVRPHMKEKAGSDAAVNGRGQ